MHISKYNVDIKNTIFQNLQIDRIRHQNINNNNLYTKRHLPGIFLTNSNRSINTQSSEVDYFPQTYKNWQKSKIDIFDNSKNNDSTEYSSSTTGNNTLPK